MVHQDREERVAHSKAEPLLTYSQVAAELHVKKGTLFYWVARGEIPYVRLGPRTVRFRRDELMRWLEARAVRELEPSVEANSCRDRA